MGYIMNLRKKVGHDTLIGLGATTLVFNKNDKFFIKKAFINTGL